jgi:predicted Zn-dependent protease
VVQQELARALEAAKRTEEAAGVYQQVLQRMPQAHITRGLLAELLFNQGRGEDAVGVFRAGLERDPAAPLLHRGLGSLLERTGRHAEAAVAYLEYARLAPGAGDAVQLTERANLLKTRVAAQ